MNQIIYHPTSKEDKTYLLLTGLPVLDKTVLAGFTDFILFHEFLEECNDERPLALQCKQERHQEMIYKLTITMDIQLCIDIEKWASRRLLRSPLSTNGVQQLTILNRAIPNIKRCISSNIPVYYQVESNW